uniref:MYND-type domain-containing protein n=2 Tax=Aureoumbra lagunensis TaxID=44058 RepID=A0A6S8EP11_9STRA
MYRDSFIECYIAGCGIDAANDIKLYRVLDRKARGGCRHAREYLREKASTNAQAAYRFSRYLRSQGDVLAQEYFDRARNMGLDNLRNFPICASCGNVGLDVSLCGRCRRKYFCGPACIQKAWQVHRHECSRS